MLTNEMQRQHFFGSNRIPSAPSESIWALMWDAVQDPTLIILIIAAIISLVFGLTLSHFDDLEWVEGIAILVSVMIVVFVASFNDYQKEKQFKALQAQQVSLRHSLGWLTWHRTSKRRSRSFAMESSRSSQALISWYACDGFFEWHPII
jgi:magnesium-transporting ATPase (P-type)